MVATVELSLSQARSLAITAQGLSGTSISKRASSATKVDAVGGVLHHLGAVQLDTISVLARSHELIPYARLGAVGRGAVEEAYWGQGSGNDHPTGATSFEYWSHAACILPIEMWPWFSLRRRAFQRRGVRWHDVPTKALDGVRQQLRERGPLTSTDLGGAKKGGAWWDWSETKIAVEWLLDIGDVVCIRRVGWRRVYDLAERAIPDEHRESDLAWVDQDGVYGPSDADCMRELLLRSVRSLGVGTLADVLDVHRLGSKDYSRPMILEQLTVLEDQGEIAKASVPGWSGTSFADVRALDATHEKSRTTLLSPFDSLVWYRSRVARLFDFDFQLEAYVPAPKRVHGYFTMPVLHGGRLIARVDPKRIKDTLHVRQVTFEQSSGGKVSATNIRAVATALNEAAAWVGCTKVVVDRVIPDHYASALMAHVGASQT
jgi:hypothetical protein